MKYLNLLSITCVALYGIQLHAQLSKVQLDVFAPTEIWNFNPGSEYPGAQGNFQLLKTEIGTAVGVLSYDFTAGGSYVAAGTTVDIIDEFRELRIQARANQQLMMGVRLRDSTDQVHQWQMAYGNVGEWQRLRVDLKRPAGSHFSGANDGVIHYPIRSIQLLVNGNLVEQLGSVQFSELQLIR